jgi:hypothetical protein
MILDDTRMILILYSILRFSLLLFKKVTTPSLPGKETRSKTPKRITSPKKRR